jgi:hypothetical protein
LNDEVAETLALWNVEKGLGEVSGMSGMVRHFDEHFASNFSRAQSFE